MKPNKRDLANQAIHRLIGTVKIPIPGSAILFRYPWEYPHYGGHISFGSPNGSLTFSALGGKRAGRVRVTLTILHHRWQDICYPSEMERTVSRFFRAWEKHPHTQLTAMGEIKVISVKGIDT